MKFAAPPVVVTVALPVAVFPHGKSSMAKTTAESAAFTETVTGSTSVHPAAEVALI